MRLTLRTLLAYLDDRLPSGSAKEIGQKVTSSPFATELAERIRSVVRRRRLAKESVGQKTIDANLIAEYLDDQLTPELVALIERQILSSDATLAEVAATHQIIGTLKDPVELGDSLKDRLYKLGPQPDAEQTDAEIAANDSGWKPLEAQTVRQKRSPMLLLGAMTLGWLALVATDSSLFQSATSPNAPGTDPEPPGRDIAGAEDAEDADVLDARAADSNADADSDPAAVGSPKTISSQAATTTTENEQQALATNMSQQDVKPTEPSGDPTIPAATSVMDATPADSNSVDNLNTPNTTPDSTLTTSNTPTSTDTVSEPPTVATFPIDLVDGFQMTVRLADDSTTWNWVANSNDDSANANWESNGRWTEQMANSVFGVPGPFDAQLLSPELGWQTTLRGSTLFTAIADGSGIRIIDGDLVLRQLDNGKSPKAFAVECGKSRFEVAAPSLNRHVGVSIRPLPVNELDVPEESEVSNYLPIGRPCLITVYAADTPAEVRIGDDQISINMGMQLQWLSNSETLPKPESSIIPDWVFDLTKPKTESTNELLAETATALRSSGTVATAADSLLEDRNPLKAEYSVILPGLTKQLDLLCGTLLATEKSVVRTATITQLQQILTTSPGAKDRIVELLRSRLPEIDTEKAMKMLMGISSVAAEDRNESEWLVNMLDSSRAPLRELAIYNLKNLTGVTENFMADDEPGRRTSAVKRWKRRLTKNDGRILPSSE